MRTRHRYVPNWTPVDWAEVERLREKYQPWDDRQVLRVDAADDLDENLTRALRWVGESPD
jgi:hypothetical protein